MKTTYPAIVHEEDGSFWVEFPDLEGCFSDGDTMADAISNAADALGGYLCSLMDRDVAAPAASNAKEIDPDGGIVTIIVTDPLSYKRSTKSVKKTLTIPEWLNEEAEKRHLNFSSVLQKALVAMIQ
ncbi:MAG: type II toxin-antitoxin system HicB family antitoxin [Clostridia bacterium]|nr:type II toxin-antitoxin system HicB family antitoxin [Clostridia bacterium]